MKYVFTIIVGIAGIISAVFTVMQYYASLQPSQQQASPRQSTTVIQPPVVDLTPNPETAAVTKVILMSFGSITPIVSYSVTNLGWADNMRNVEYSLWAVLGGRLTKVDERSAPFIAKGEYSAAEKMRAPFATGKMVVCVSYIFKNRNVNVIDFYSNETASSLQRQIGEMTRFRESLSQVDGSSDLCRSMPNAAARYI